MAVRTKATCTVRGRLARSCAFTVALTLAASVGIQGAHAQTIKPIPDPTGGSPPTAAVVVGDAVRELRENLDEVLTEDREQGTLVQRVREDRETCRRGVREAILYGGTANDITAAATGDCVTPPVETVRESAGELTTHVKDCWKAKNDGEARNVLRACVRQPLRTVKEWTGVDVLRRLRGTVLGPSDAAYDRVRALWKGTIDRRPATVAYCEAADAWSPRCGWRGNAD